jgi:hypothetical protein
MMAEPQMRRKKFEKNQNKHAVAQKTSVQKGVILPAPAAPPEMKEIRDCFERRDTNGEFVGVCDLPVIAPSRFV